MESAFRRYWIEFEFNLAWDLPLGIARGCGVTAYNLNDALDLIDKEIFHLMQRPKIKRVI